MAKHMNFIRATKVKSSCENTFCLDRQICLKRERSILVGHRVLLLGYQIQLGIHKKKYYPNLNQNCLI